MTEMTTLIVIALFLLSAIVWFVAGWHIGRIRGRQQGLRVAGTLIDKGINDLRREVMRAKTWNTENM